MIVGNNWLRFSQLNTLNFDGLSKLRIVGDGWLYNCQNLEYCDYSHLCNLHRVGFGWAINAVKLKIVNLKGLYKIKLRREFMNETLEMYIQQFLQNVVVLY